MTGVTVTCQCPQIPGSGCPDVATQEDFLCDLCRGPVDGVRPRPLKRSSIETAMRRVAHTCGHASTAARDFATAYRQ